MTRLNLAYTVTKEEITPIAQQYGGVQGDDNSTVLKIDVTNIHSTSVYIKYRIEYVTGSGQFGSSSALSVVKETNGSSASYFVTYSLGSEITSAGGIATLNLLQVNVDADLCEQFIYYSYPMRLYFSSSANASSGLNYYKRGLTGLALETERLKNETEELYADTEEIYSATKSMFDNFSDTKLEKNQGGENYGSFMSVDYSGEVKPKALEHRITNTAGETEVVSAKAIYNEFDSKTKRIESLEDTCENEQTGLLTRVGRIEDNYVSKDGIFGNQGIEVNSTTIKIDDETFDKINSFPKDNAKPIAKTLSGKILFADDVTENEVLEISGEGVVQILGKNILKYPFYSGVQDVEVNGITFSENSDGVICASGTATADAAYIIHSADEGIAFLKGNYFLCGAPSGAGENSYYLTAFGGFCDYGEGVECQVEDNTNLNVAIVIKQGVSVDNLLFYPMLSLRKFGVADFEKYSCYTGRIGDNIFKAPKHFMSVIAENEIVLNYNANTKLYIDNSDDAQRKLFDEKLSIKLDTKMANSEGNLLFVGENDEIKPILPTSSLEIKNEDDCWQIGVGYNEDDLKVDDNSRLALSDVIKAKINDSEQNIERLDEIKQNIPVDFHLIKKHTVNYSLTTDATFQENKRYYTKVNNKFNWLSEGTDYYVGDEITSEIYAGTASISITTDANAKKLDLSQLLCVIYVPSAYKSGVISGIIGANTWYKVQNIWSSTALRTSSGFYICCQVVRNRGIITTNQQVITLVDTPESTKVSSENQWFPSLVNNKEKYTAIDRVTLSINNQDFPEGTTISIYGVNNNEN